VHLLVCYLNKPQNARCNDKDCASDLGLYDSRKRRTKRKQSKPQNMNPLCSVSESVSVQIPYITKAQNIKSYQRYFMFSSLSNRVCQYNFTPPHCMQYSSRVKGVDKYLFNNRSPIRPLTSILISNLE